MRGWNFSAGPAAIPEEVISEVRNELLEYDESGASIIEISHRTKLYTSLVSEIKKDHKIGRHFINLSWMNINKCRRQSFWECTSPREIGWDSIIISN